MRANYPKKCVIFRLLRDLIPKRPDLRIVLMSATVNADLFAAYFPGKVPIVDIPGKTFPVTQWFLEDILDDCGYALDHTSEYARPFNRDGGGGPGSKKASLDVIYKGLGEYADCVDEADLADALSSGAQVSNQCYFGPIH